MGMAKKSDSGAKPVAGAPKQEAPRRRPGESQPVVQMTADGRELRGIVRMAGRDLRGNWKLTRAIGAIKGIGSTLGRVVSKIAIKELGLNEKTMIGELDEAQIERLEEMLANPQKCGVRQFMLNRQKEFVSGEAHHLISTDLVYAVKQDVEHEKDSQTWKGYRHAYGQKVRGQRTRTTGRTGMTVGVLRKAVRAAAGAAAAGVATGAPGAAAPAGAVAKEEKPKPAAKEAEKK